MDKPAEFVIETRGLEKHYGSVAAVGGVDLKVPAHSIFGFLGPNGAGKSTFMKMLLGLVHPSAGSAAIFGRDIHAGGEEIRERIGYLPQHPRFIEHMTARENLLLTAEFFFERGDARVSAHCDSLLEMVGLSDTADRPVNGFSGGEKQRLGIAIAQVNQPDLLILDEPAAALDPIGRQAVLDLMERLREHTTIFYSTHILDDVQRVSDSVAIMNHGRLAASGPIEQMIHDRSGGAFSVVVKGSDDGLNEKLGQFSWVDSVDILHSNGRCAVQVHVSDCEMAEERLLHYVLVDAGRTVIEFRQKTFDLEDVFMEIIGGEHHVN